MCVCVCEREIGWVGWNKERERERDERGRERERERGREREGGREGESGGRGGWSASARGVRPQRSGAFVS